MQLLGLLRLIIESPPRSPFIHRAIVDTGMSLRASEECREVVGSLYSLLIDM